MVVTEIPVYNDERLQRIDVAAIDTSQIVVIRRHLTNPNHYTDPMPGWSGCQEIGLVVLTTGDRLLVTLDDMATLRRIWSEDARG